MKKERVKLSTVRIEFFSDAVIAIIITLMALEIHLPKIKDGSTPGELFHQLKPLLPNVIAYIISFTALGVFWVNHHQFYSALDQVDRKLLWLNLHFLFWCSTIPFCTVLLAENFRNPASTAIYGFVQFCSGAAFGLMHMHAVRHRLYRPNISSQVLKNIKRINMLSTPLIVISIFAGFISVYISIFLFAFVPALYFLPQNPIVEVEELD